MRLNELKGYKGIAKNIGDNWDSSLDNMNRVLGVEEYLIKQGLTKTGFGGYSTVWDYGNQNSLLKIFNRDKGYSAWIRYCQKNKSNPYCPRFKSKVIPINNKHKVFGIIIEKLEPCNDAEYKLMRYKTQLLELYLLSKANYDDLNERFGNAKDWWFNNFMENPPAPYDKIVDDDKVARLKKYIEYTLADRNLTKIYFAISKYRSLSYDDKQANIMKRGNQLVFIDPLADVDE